MMTLPRVIACPVCGLVLQDEAQRWSCANGHSFDRARQGYLNLLVAQHKKSKAPGDNMDMVDARQRLLDSQLYRPISDLLNQWVLELSLNQTAPLHIADVGCGEGYYTQRLQEVLEDHQLAHRLYGVDISKDALKRAARRSNRIDWLVASGGQLPFLPHSLDMITCLFTNLMPQGFARVLKPGAPVILLNTGSDHLLELRQQIYGEVNRQAFDPVPAMQQHGYQLSGDQPLTYQTQLTSQQAIMDLLLMTPHRWKIRDEALQRLQQLDELPITIDVRLQQFTYSGATA
ncbi:methyltransferase domain-containing protein [Venatoribacter cucullus]|uniref:Methyltransferase domain-containing protein n=1 Tax=Venatoribacter cucullus TaxID=2661630 RepID=A0A9X7UWV4_9GAMM|nr:methyltransferase domain-containing protein [Venatoribacter cucullus]QQD21724.1 methyltransferase domain-containing protein [Oceanospirillaceae bacterium ASx5O]QQD24408.1 methyltransferase domain-containing protein [Venatoribacter cucullus]